MMRALALLVAVFAFFVPALALAAPQLRTSLTPSTIEVGDTATFSVAIAPGDKVSEARLGTTPNGLSLTGQGLTPSFQITVNNGQLSQVTTMRATFRLRATREGTYTIGPAAITVDGARVVSDRATLHVVAKGTLPPSR